jgi:hypothetical protein
MPAASLATTSVMATGLAEVLRPEALVTGSLPGMPDARLAAY